MNSRRLIFGPIIGALTGIACVIGNLATIPLNSPQSGFLFVAFWERVLLGIALGFAGELNILKNGNPLINSIIRGLLFGMIFSFHMAFFSGIFGINYFLVGSVFGIAIDVILTKFVN